MALLASSTLPSSPQYQIKVFRNKPCQFRRCVLSHAPHQISPTCSMKVTKGHFGEPSKVKLQLKIVKERWLHAIPDSVKEFPWRKAEDLLLKQLLLVGQKAFKWSLIILFLFSFLSDVMYSISRNWELMIPLGLLVGCLMMDFLKEISMEVFQASEKRGLSLPLLGFSCCFILVKVISTYLTPSTQPFLLHVANGGLMQVLWLWGDSLKENNQAPSRSLSTMILSPHSNSLSTAAVASEYTTTIPSSLGASFLLQKLCRDHYQR